MHRTKPQFAQRVNRCATALERRGIRATYALHDKRNFSLEDGPEPFDAPVR